jgi:hypothetical protein
MENCQTFEQEIYIMVDRRNIYFLLNPPAFYYVFRPPALVFFVLSLTYYYFLSLVYMTMILHIFHVMDTHTHKIKCKIYINMRLSCIWVWFISFIIYFILYSSDFELQVCNKYFNFKLSDPLLKLKERCLDANITSWVLHHNFIHCCSFIHRYAVIYSEMYIWPFTNNDIITIYNLCVLCAPWGLL